MSDAGRGPRGRAPWLYVAVAGILAAALVVGLALLLPRRDDGDRRVTATAADARGALQTLLDRRAHAAAVGDERGWLSGVAGGTGYAARQRDAFTALRLLRATHVGFRVSGEPREQSDGSVVLDAVGEWAIPGYDEVPARYPLCLRARQVHGAWELVDDAGAGTVHQAFDLPGLRALASPRGLVVGDAAQAQLSGYAQALAGAVDRVDHAWGRLPRPPVVVLPATSEEFADLVGRQGQDVSGVAAVTYGQLQPGTTARGDKVVVNPAAWARLTPQGRSVILTHELTHLDVRATTTRSVPEWLSEGYAVHVSYSGLTVDPRRAAPELLAQVRGRGAPATLPSERDLDGTEAGTAYDEAWLAVEHLVATRGEQATTRFYRDLATGVPETQAWARLGTTENQLVSGWQADLQRLARADPTATDAP